jgi:hypothetical protein
LKFKIWKVTPAPVKPVKRKRAIVYSDKEDKNIIKIELSFLYKQNEKTETPPPPQTVQVMEEGNHHQN